ncbi:hypothetical protein LCGC14_2555070 [marine sediment metagenome]|uniref:Uncharacterized protein n=1 Tax=marine sediment metagenome TaxID=412755 RepID=A0A0F9B9M7_9ZZZZ
MSTNAKPGIGVVLNRWEDATTSGAWEVISEVQAIGWGGSSRKVIDVFKLDNADEYMNKLQGILDAGTISATILFTQSQFVQLKADHEYRGSRSYQIVFPDGEGLEWDGFISELPLNLGADDAMKGEVVFVIDGKPDFVTAAGAAP